MATTKVKTKKTTTSEGTGGKLSKAQLFERMAELSGLTKKEVDAAYRALLSVVAARLRSAGMITLPGIATVKAVKKDALPERPGKDPFSGEPKIFKARPASVKVRLGALKALKDAVA